MSTIPKALTELIKGLKKCEKTMTAEEKQKQRVSFIMETIGGRADCREVTWNKF